MSYLNVVEVEAAIANLALAYPSRCRLIPLPEETVEHRRSHALSISSAPPGTRDAVVILAGVHAREWGSCEIVVNLATDLLRAYTAGTGLGYGGATYSSQHVRRIVDDLELVIFPCVNPDGRHHSQSVDHVHDGGAAWRKNRNPASSDGTPRSIGIDLNRNYDFAWDVRTLFSGLPPGSNVGSDVPSSDVFHGTAPFSEPETRNVRWLVEGRPRTRWLVDVHSYSEQVLFEWGDDTNQSTDPSQNFANPAHNSTRGMMSAAYGEYIHGDDAEVARRLAERLRDGISTVRGKTYTAKQSFALYPVSGAVCDWAFARHIVDPSKGKVHGFTIEWGKEFIPAWTEMAEIVKDVTSGLLNFCLAAPCAGGAVAVAPVTQTLTFNDVPANSTTTRAIVVSSQTCGALTLNVTAGPTLSSGAGTFGLPLGATATLPSAATAITRQSLVWVSFTAGAAGTVATGTITVTCTETGGSWTIPITANAIARPKVASVLVLDRSGSMDQPSGLPGLKRIDILHASAPGFVGLLGDDDAIGVVAFDTDAAISAPVVTAGAPGFGPGRLLSSNAIGTHVTDLLGSTSIGDGVSLAHDLLAPVAGFDGKAIVVFTDGHENEAKLIKDIQSKIDDKVFAIGLGTVNELNPVTLNRLVSNSGGYLLLTGKLDLSQQFRLPKYFLQVLSGVTNREIVVDPDGLVVPGSTARVPFEISEADEEIDVVLLSPARKVLDFWLETPEGDVVDPSTVGSLAGSTLSANEALTFYRVALPAAFADHGSSVGRWYAVIELDRRGYAELRRSSDANAAVGTSLATANGIAYSVSVQARSTLRFDATAVASRLEPPARIDLSTILTQAGLPLDGRATVTVYVARPSGGTQVVTLTENGPGEFEGGCPAPQAGIYECHFRAAGTSLAGRPFTREQVRTVAVWFGTEEPGGEEPGGKGGGERDSTDDGPGDGRGCDCGCHGLVRCLLADPGLERALLRLDVDVDALRRCVEDR